MTHKLFIECDNSKCNSRAQVQLERINALPEGWIGISYASKNITQNGMPKKFNNLSFCGWTCLHTFVKQFLTKKVQLNET